MVITSVNNEHIKEICKLKEKKYRDLKGTFLIEGDHLLNEALSTKLVLELIVLDGQNYHTENITTTYVNKEVMKKISSMDSYPNVIAVCKKKEEEEIKGNALILEDIQDPGNLGTIIRSAVAFNIDTIVLSPRTVDLYNPKVIRSTQGMMFHINIIERETTTIINRLQEEDYIIYGTKVDNGIDVKTINTNKKYALIIGNEGTGMSNEVSNLCDECLYIKMNNNVESLNAAVAASILLYELGGK